MVMPREQDANFLLPLLEQMVKELGLSEQRTA